MHFVKYLLVRIRARTSIGLKNILATKRHNNRPTKTQADEQQRKYYRFSGFVMLDDDKKNRYMTKKI